MEDIKDMQSLDERTGWAFLWTRAEWTRQFLVLTPEVLKIYSSNQRNDLVKMISVAKTTVGFHKPWLLGEPQASKNPSKKRLWKSLSKLVLSDQSISQVDLAMITIKQQRGKTCYLVFPSEAEAEVWKAGVDEAIVLTSVSRSKKNHNKLSRRNKAMRQASEALDQTRMFLKTKSLLLPPFGLRWQAYSPLLKIQKAKESAKHAIAFSRETEKAKTSETLSTPFIKLDPTESLWHDLETLNGCTNFLCSTYLNLRALEHTSLMIDHFKSSYQMGDSSLPNELRVEAWKGTVHRIVKALVDQLLLNNPSLEHCTANDDLLEQLWRASEIWVFGAVHDKIMGACKQMLAAHDSSLNDILARLEKVDPAKLGVRAEFELLVLGEALNEFRRLNQFRTPYEKAMCLRKTVMCILDGIQSLIKSCTGALNDVEGLLPCTDDLLSFMLLLMARAKVRNLHANACYMENFMNMQKDAIRGELLYHITNFMGACKYLHSEAVEELLADPAVSPKTTVSQKPGLSGDSRSSSPSLYRRPQSSFEGSSGTRFTSSSSRLDSLDSEANEGRWEDAFDRDLCFEQEAFCNNWRWSDTANRVDLADFDVTENPFMCDRASMEGEYSVERDNSKSYSRHIGTYVLALPGESPGFLLAPTYQ